MVEIRKLISLPWSEPTPMPYTHCDKLVHSAMINLFEKIMVAVVIYIYSVPAFNPNIECKIKTFYGLTFTCTF